MKFSWLGVGAGGGQYGFLGLSLFCVSRASTDSDISLKFRAHATFTSSARLKRWEPKYVMFTLGKLCMYQYDCKFF